MFKFTHALPKSLTLKKTRLNFDWLRIETKSKRIHPRANSSTDLVKARTLLTIGIASSTIGNTLHTISQTLARGTVTTSRSDCPASATTGSTLGLISETLARGVVTTSSSGCSVSATSVSRLGLISNTLAGGIVTASSSGCLA